MAARRGPEFQIYNAVFASLMLMLESQHVVELRLVRIAWGGEEARSELQSMVSEKICAAIEATGTLMLGGSPDAVIARYREHVAANAKRLGAA